VVSLRTVTLSLLFQAVLAPLAVPLIYVVVGVTEIVEPVPRTVSVVGVPSAVTASPVPSALTAVPLALALKYLVVAAPIPVATVTSPAVPLAIVMVGSVTLKVEAVPSTVSVEGLA